MNNSPPKQHVILLHGLASYSFLFWPMTRVLRALGFVTHTWGYFSFRGSIEKHAARLTHYLNEFPCGPGETIHLIGHSMGSIIIRRSLLESDLPDNLGRFVMIGPPNRGSHVATRFAKYLGWLCPALSELSDCETSYVRKLEEPHGYDIGIVKAQRDLVVRSEYTKLTVAKQVVCFPGLHTSVLFDARVGASIGAFLLTGKFLPEQE